MRDFVWIGLVLFHVLSAFYAGMGAMENLVALRAEIPKTCLIDSRKPSTELFKYLTARMVRRARVSGLSGIVALLTGVALIFKDGGFSAVTVNFHVALGLLTLMIAFGISFLRPTLGKLHRIVEGGLEPTAPDVTALMGRAKVGLTVMGSLWFTVLVLMFVRF